MASVWDQLFGGGLLLGGSLLDKEPGEVGQARQFQRNLFTSNEAIPGAYAALLNSFNTMYGPALAQQETDLLNQVQQRAFPGLPGSFSPNVVGGPERASLLETATNTLIPRRQALLADLSREALGVQSGAAQGILSTSKPDPLASSIAKLGMILLLSNLMGRGGSGGVGSGGALQALQGLFGGGQGVGAGQGSGVGSLINSLFGGGGGLLPMSTGQLSAADIIGQMQAGTLSAAEGISLLARTQPGFLAGTLGSGILGTVAGKEAGQGLFGSTAESGTAGNIGGGVGSIAGAILGSLLLPGPGTVIGAGLGGAAGGVAGSGVKQPDTSRRETFQGALGGAFGGLGAFLAGQGNQSTGENLRDAAIVSAATALLGPIGGILSGGILGKQRGAEIEKAQRRAEDLASQTGNFNQVASFWTNAVGLSGGDTEKFNSFITSQKSIIEQGPGQVTFDGLSFFTDQAEAVAHVGGRLVLAEIQKIDPSIQSLDHVPGFRQKYLDWARQHIQNDPTAAIEWGLRKEGY